MKITKFTDYALRTLMFLASNQNTTKLHTSKQIAAFHHISYHHMGKIVHKLSTLGYIESIKGKNGGILLKKHPADIDLKTLFLVLENDLNIVECFDAKTNTCKIYKNCGLKKILNESLGAFINTLGKYTLKDTLLK
ncbi:MAG: Rrf2 family transcriptional regulator [Bdellovibrionales bacterium]|nr:Rrf2 family transcriptional regulator [Bdellovibrionales bacterium]